MPIAAAIQLNSTSDLHRNLAMTAELIAQAVKTGAQLVVLPEMFPLMAADEKAKVRIKESFGQGLIQDFLAEQAQKNNTWIVGGTIPIKAQGEHHIRAACIVYDNQGKAVARYDKIHLFDVSIEKGQEIYKESDTTEPGDELVVIDTPIGKLGLAVCYDLRFPELFRELLSKGAEVIAVPAAFTFKTGKAHWDILTRSRSIENLCYAIYACQSGMHSPNRKTYGHSMIVDPWGKVISQLSEDVGFLSGDIDLNYLRELRQHFPATQHRRVLEYAVQSSSRHSR